MREYMREYHKKHPEKRAQAWAKHYAKNRQAVLDSARVRRKAGYDPVRKRHYHMKEYYGIDGSAVDAMILAQDGKCAACGLPFEGTGRSKLAPVVDHDHETKKIRGILHGICNRVEGQLSPAQLRGVADYIERHRA